MQRKGCRKYMVEGYVGTECQKHIARKGRLTVVDKKKEVFRTNA